MSDYAADLALFADYVQNAEAVPFHAKWVRANPQEAAAWAAFRDALLAGQSPVPPVMATKYGKELVDAGKEHMSISHLVGVVTNPYPPVTDTQPPSVPVGQIDSVTDTTITLSWSASTDNVGVHHYNLYLGNGPGAAAQSFIAQTSNLTYQFTGLSAATAYSVGIEAVDALGNRSDLNSAIWWPVTTASSGPTTITSYSDMMAIFAPDWKLPASAGITRGSGVNELASTVYGQGFHFIVTPDMPTVWDATDKAVLARLAGVSSPGQTQTWDFKVYIPTQTLPNDWQAGTIFELHTDSPQGGSSGHNLAMYSNGVWRIVRQNGPNQTYEFVVGPAINFDAWTTVSFEIGWSYGTDGHIYVDIDGIRQLTRDGVATLFDPTLPWCQFGWYSKALQTNEITFAGVQHSEA